MGRMLEAPALDKSRLHFREPIGVLGYGVEGKSSVQFLKWLGFKDIFILDKNPGARPDALPGYFGEDHLKHLSEFKTLIRSAGIRPEVPEITAFVKSGGMLTSQIEILFQLYPKEKIIGITGTLGKGTCASLVSDVFTRAKIPHLLGGNLGIAALDLLMESDHFKDWPYLILELSSFQLFSLKTSAHISVILKTTSEHLDWHASQTEYWEAKANLVKYQNTDDVCVYEESSKGSLYIAGQSSGKKIPVGTSAPFCLNDESIQLEDGPLTLSEVKLSGSFNLENLAAAAAVAQLLKIDSKIIRESLSLFSGLKHRLEFLAEKNGIKFYNDSYATRPDATLGALKSFSSSDVYLILGGSEKFADFTELSNYIGSSSNIKKIALMGATAKRLKEELLGVNPNLTSRIKTCPHLPEALSYLLENSPKGICLLSPACASFGLFKNYGERGEAFRKWVQEWIKSISS